MTSVFILACGRQGPMIPWSVEATQQKALLEIADDYKVIDFQIDALLRQKLNDIYVVVGWKKDEVITHCNNRGYKVKFVEDPHWEHGAYSSGRTLWEIQDILWSASFPIITLYGDILFSQKLLENVLNCKGDVCCILDRQGDGRQDLIKWTKNGLKFVLEILDSKEMRENKDGLNNPVWIQLKWRNIKSKRREFHGQRVSYNAIRAKGMAFHNINNDVRYNEAKKWFQNKLKNSAT